jgi:hypothetical protein
MSCSGDEEAQMDTAIAEFQKNAVEKIRVALRDYKGKRLIDMRIYYQDDAGGRLPTKKDPALTIEQWPELREALDKRAEAMQGER